MSSSYRRLVELLREKMGIVLFDDTLEDFAISDYIYESIEFINFIIAVEEEFDIELTDDFLNYEILTSAKGFSEKLDYLIETA